RLQLTARSIAGFRPQFASNNFCIEAIHKRCAHSDRPESGPPSTEQHFAKRLVIGNSSNRNLQTDSGMVKLAAVAVFLCEARSSPTRRTSESNSCNVLNPQFLRNAKSPTFRP